MANAYFAADRDRVANPYAAGTGSVADCYAARDAYPLAHAHTGADAYPLAQPYAVAHADTLAYAHADARTTLDSARRRDDRGRC